MLNTIFLDFLSPHEIVHCRCARRAFASSRSVVDTIPRRNFPSRHICTDDSCDSESGCSFVPNAAQCDDGNACTVNDGCAKGWCTGGGQLDCDDDNLCTNDACDLVDGCIHFDNVLACEDGNACTAGDMCAASICVGGAPLDCDDDNVCTDDSCNPAIGCVNVANEAPCSDWSSTSGAASGTLAGGAGP